MTHKIKILMAGLIMALMATSMHAMADEPGDTGQEDGGQVLDSAFYTLIEKSQRNSKNQPYVALEDAAQARMIAEQSGDKLAMAQSYYTLGECYLQTRIYYLAMEMFFKGFEIFSTIGDEDMVAKSLVNIAKTYYAQEVFNLAEEYCIKAINICQAFNCSEAMADALATLGQISIITNEDVAISNMKRAKNIFDSLNIVNKSIDINISLARAYTHLDMQDSAIELLDYSLEKFLLSGDKSNIARTYLTLADTYYSINDYPKASTYYNTALKQFADCKMVHDGLEARIKLARLQYRSKEFANALENALKVLQDAQLEEIQHGTEEIMIKHRACYLIYNVYKINGDIGKSLIYCEKFAQTGDSIYMLKKQEQFSEFQVSLESQQREKELEMMKMNSEKEMLLLEKKASQYRTIFLIIIITLVAIVVVIYYRRYKEKLVNNTALALSNSRMEQEIQERKIAETELRNSEAKYHLLFQKTPVGIIQFNDKAIITASNDRLSQILKLKSKNIIGQDLYSLIPQKAFEGYNPNKDLQQSDDGKMFKKEIKISTPGGEVYLSISLKSYEYHTGTEIEKGGIMILEDITERKEADEHKLIYNAASNDIINIIPESIYLLDAKGNYIFARIPDLPVSEQNAYIGKNMREMLRPDILLPYLVAFNTVRKTGEEQYAEYQEEDDPSCQQYYEARFIACEGDKVLVIVHDISRQKIAENKLKRAKTSAESGSKAKSEFILGMTTEIKEPLERILRGCEELVALSPENELSPKLKTMLNTTLSVNEHITDVLKLTEVEACKINTKSINPSALARDVFEIFRSRAEEKNLEYTFESDPSLPKELHLDEVRIRQILFNILANALKYTSEGSVKLATGLLNGENGKQTISFAISDTGIGLSDEQKASIFQGGNGKTGMALTKKMSDSLKGSINIQSELGKGSVFTFLLPITMSNIEQPSSKASSQKEISHASEKASRKKHNDSMREYISVLKFAVIPEYKNLKSDMSFDTLTQFVTKFKEQSTHYHIDKGVEIADELLVNIQNYDISNITINIRKLETYILTSIKELQGE